ncbi:Uncharacterised protein [Serratia quinivorans]|nr:Uncharacterised protein [Serratia quinivorans]
MYENAGLIHKRLNSGELVTPFPKMELKWLG